MATAARPAWVEGGDLDGAGGGRVTPAAVSARRTPTGPEHHGVPSGSQTERTRGRHGGRARRRHFATTRSRFAQQMEQRQVGATLDNMSLETEAHINRKLAEMQQRDLASVNRLAGKLRKDYDRLRVQSASKAQELRAVQEQLMRLERLGSGGGPDTRSQEGPAGAIALAEQKLEVRGPPVPLALGRTVLLTLVRSCHAVGIVATSSRSARLPLHGPHLTSRGTTGHSPSLRGRTAAA